MVRLGLACIWLLHFLPLALLSRLGAWLGAVLYYVAAPRRRVVLLFGLNAVLNVAWSALFFTLKRPDWALMEWAGLWLSVVSLVVGIPLAWALARAHVPGLRLARALVTVPLVLPPVVGGIALLLASDASAWNTGAIIPLDGGNMAMNAGGTPGHQLERVQSFSPKS